MEKFTSFKVRLQQSCAIEFNVTLPFGAGEKDALKEVEKMLASPEGLELIEGEGEMLFGQPVFDKAEKLFDFGVSDEGELIENPV